ncbi:uncharacterized protein LOC143290721 [Babylonia areolata]|uniref:uncharacterized protein LOC143290721 n=1 Tax=Babylonia areolata TaxID=304850 RepID=UPI003FD1ED61
MLTPRKKAAVLLLAVALVAIVTLAVFYQHLGLTFRQSILPALGALKSRLAVPARAPLNPPTANGSITSGAVTAKRKKIVYACSGGCGGWADRQKGIVGAYVLAAMLGRDFGIHISFPCDLGRLLGPGKVRWAVRAEDLAGPHAHHYTSLDHAAVVFTQSFLAQPDLQQHFPHDVSVFTWNMEVVQFLQKHQLASGIEWLAGQPYPEVYRRVLTDLFTFKPDLQKQLDDLQNSRPPGTRLVCAQMRLGKHNGSFPDVESWQTFENFPILVDFLAKYNDSRKYRLLVASDSVEIVQRAKAKFPEVLVTIPGPITHTDKSRGADACEGFKKAILDEYALSLCDVLVISESGLGKIASFLRHSDLDLFLFHGVHIDPFTRRGTFPNKSGW